LAFTSKVYFVVVWSLVYKRTCNDIGIILRAEMIKEDLFFFDRPSRVILEVIKPMPPDTVIFIVSFFIEISRIN